MRIARVAFMGVGAAAAVALSLTASANAATPEAIEQSPPCKVSVLSAQALSKLGQEECDPSGVTVVTPDGTTMVVPAHGEIVSTSASSDETGEAAPDVSLLNSEEGELALSVDGVVIAASAQGAQDMLTRHNAATVNDYEPSSLAPAGKCNADAPYSLDVPWWGYVYDRNISSNGRPGDWTWDSILATAGTIIEAGNSSDCGDLGNGLQPDNSVYTVTSPTPTGVTATGCGVSDGENIVGWGDLSGTTLGRACWWVIPLGSRSEADIKIDTSSRSWWLSTATTGCTGSTYDLLSVAIHEHGHAVGLNHVDDTSQAMRPVTPACNFDGRALGRGDQNGLRALYGP